MTEADLMTQQYYLWLDSIAKRDSTLLTLATISIYMVASWLALDWALRNWSKPTQAKIRNAFLVGGLALYIVTLAISGGG